MLGTGDLPSPIAGESLAMCSIFGIRMMRDVLGMFQYITLTGKLLIEAVREPTRGIAAFPGSTAPSPTS